MQRELLRGSFRRSLILGFATCGLTLAFGSGVVAQDAPHRGAAGGATAGDTDPADHGWPRKFEANGFEVIVFAPQVDEWPKFERVTFRAAISVGLPGNANPTFGVIRVSANTQIAYDQRLVALTDRRVESLTFKGVEPPEAERLRGIVKAAMPPEHPQTVSLDRLVAAMDPAKMNLRKVDVNTAPPKIYSSDTPALLVMFMGKPKFKPAPDSDLMFAVNTNWDLFLDSNAQKYYLLDDHSWLVTSDLEKGAWTAAGSLPASLSNLPANDNWNEVRAAIPGVPATVVPKVLVTHEPAELIVTQGAPAFEPIAGTQLMTVSNTDSYLFYNTPEKQFYFLAAGRWFKAGALAGPWAAASDSLPADFKKIPDSPEMAGVLAAVPGTPEANEAIIMASIPQKATIKRNDMSLNVTYNGAPQFQPIASTNVQSATNTAFKVFLVDGKYYCCNNAVWFESMAPDGGWKVCGNVPLAIYTIPPSNPNYNVTYVTVSDATPDTVECSYTAGYSGATVAATGAVMFGLGMAAGAAIADTNSDYYYPSSYYSYGCGAVWAGEYGGYACAAACYGPYGGAAHAAAYNPATGVYSRAGYAYGPNGAAGYRTAYNPATGTAAGHAAGVTPYGSWGSSAVTNGDKWATASHQTTAQGTTGQIHTSSGAEAATAQGRYGNGATVAKGANGDCYAAADGNVYKNTGNGWQSANSNSNANRANGEAQQRPPSEELQQQQQQRYRGEQNASRSSQYQSGGGQRSAPAGRGGRRG